MPATMSIALPAPVQYRAEVAPVLAPVPPPALAPKITLDALLAVNVLVTIGVLVLGVLAFVNGLRRRYPCGCSFLGHTWFSNYFMIAIYPIPAHYLGWSAGRALAILAFALPLWLLLHFGLMPVRR